MSATAVHGSSYRIERLTLRDLMLHEEQIRELINFYLNRSMDPVTTQAVWVSLNTSCFDKDMYSLVAKDALGKCVGFVFCRILDHMAQITSAGLTVNGHAYLIDDALDMIIGWAKQHGAKRLQFQTYRHPMAHRFMVQRGWDRVITTYDKEIK